jgi:peptide deformylase|tara:strand:- start:10642 stop:11133 length:492 start_codon:yes stop_codon:yes gene_type:complete
LAILPIQTGTDNPILRQKTEKIPKVTKEITKLIKDMEDTLKDENGLGIAANQVGQALRMCLAKFNGKTNVLINVEITWRGEETDVVEEGCLSLPDINVKVERPTEITITYLNEKGEENERKLTGMDARIVQHEVDHLDNILITDYQQHASLSTIDNQQSTFDL